MSIGRDCGTFRSMARIRAVVRMLRGHPFASDAVLAFALAAFVLSDVFTSRGYLTGSKWVYIPAALLMTVPLAWRRRVPFAVVLLVMGAFAARNVASLIVHSTAAHSQAVGANV